MQKKRILEGDTAHPFLTGGTIGVEKNIYWEEGDTTYILLIGGTFVVGTLRNLERMK